MPIAISTRNIFPITSSGGSGALTPADKSGDNDSGHKRESGYDPGQVLSFTRRHFHRPPWRFQTKSIPVGPASGMTSACRLPRFGISRSETPRACAFMTVAEWPRPSSFAICAVGYFRAMILSLATSSGVQGLRSCIPLFPVSGRFSSDAKALHRLLDDNASACESVRMRHPLRQRSTIPMPATGARCGPRRHRTE